jgi:hypothetical protein
MSKTIKLRKEDLGEFTGTDTWYRNGINPDVLFTDGAKYVADQGGAYWLLDAIAIAQRHVPSVAAEEFQVWTLEVRADRSATLTCGDGNGNTVYSQPIAFTDFPLDEISLWFENWVIYLPSEH